MATQTGATTRECSLCGVTIPAGDRTIPDYWRLDERTYELVCGGCHGRRLRKGWQAPTRGEGNSLMRARALERIDREGR